MKDVTEIGQKHFLQIVVLAKVVSEAKMEEDIYDLCEKSALIFHSILLDCTLFGDQQYQKMEIMHS